MRRTDHGRPAGTLVCKIITTDRASNSELLRFAVSNLCSLREVKTPGELFDLVTANLRLLTAVMWNSDKYAVPLRHEETGTSAAGRRYFREAFVMIRIGLLDDVEIALATDRVKTSSFCVVENVVGVAGNIECRDCVS